MVMPRPNRGLLYFCEVGWISKLWTLGAGIMFEGGGCEGGNSISGEIAAEGWGSQLW